MPEGTIFVGRVPLKPDDPLPPTQDLVLSRIFWLDGLEGHNANTRDRFIYIHGQSTRTKSASPTATDVSGCETQMSSSSLI